MQGDLSSSRNILAKKGNRENRNKRKKKEGKMGGGGGENKEIPPGYLKTFSPRRTYLFEPP